MSPLPFDPGFQLRNARFALDDLSILLIQVPAKLPVLADEFLACTLGHRGDSRGRSEPHCPERQDPFVRPRGPIDMSP